MLFRSVGGEQPSDAWADHPDDVAQHGNEDQASIKREDETSTTRCPHGPLQPVESSQFLVHSLRNCVSMPLNRGYKARQTAPERLTTHLAVPPVAKEKEVKAIEYQVEHQTARGQELAAKPAFRHGRLRQISRRGWLVVDVNVIK